MNNALPEKELRLLKRLRTPAKIQDFLDGMKINFEPNGDTCLPPLLVLKQKVCHCVEGAILAALALRINGWPPLLVDLTANKNDYDHVVAVFQKAGKWGAISKTNHAALRYREPVYNSIRELVMSYFHEYFDDTGRKNLRSFSRPVNLRRFDRQGWMTAKDDIFYIPEHLADIKHIPIINRNQIGGLRLADKIEIEAGKLVEWKDCKKRRLLVK